MQNDNASSPKAKKFQFPGSTPHYPLLFPFSVDYMMLKIKPDFDSNTLKDCMQKLKITACEDVSEIKDRKSTRLNSSHANISYAVFCLKKKKSVFYSEAMYAL